ncbi:hypothetical protein B0H14DRAFT_960755 [Mycena olivaceomarginata]|nr:hypothetical protein B0H14DRAFT_960755 [Mycena olivaceomarginata]
MHRPPRIHDNTQVCATRKNICGLAVLLPHSISSRLGTPLTPSNRRRMHTGKNRYPPVQPAPTQTPWRGQNINDPGKYYRRGIGERRHFLGTVTKPITIETCTRELPLVPASCRLYPRARASNCASPRPRGGLDIHEYSGRDWTTARSEPFPQRQVPAEFITPRILSILLFSSQSSKYNNIHPTYILSKCRHVYLQVVVSRVVSGNKWRVGGVMIGLVGVSICTQSEDGWVKGD